MTPHVEVGRTYELADGQELPPLDDLATPGRVQESDLVATYYDAGDLRLTRSRLVIRRRTGGHDQGWHLKSSGQTKHERLELFVPIDPASPDTVPAEFRGLVAGLLGDDRLAPVAVVRTRRRDQELLDAAGTVLARTRVDDVHAEGPNRSERWREAEVELAAGDPTLLDAIEKRLVAAGIGRAPNTSKVARALGDPPPIVTPTAGAAVVAHLRRQVGEFEAWKVSESGLAAGLTHDGRVALRRIRSILKTYRPLFEHARVRRLRGELRWLGLQLSPLRDGEVAASRIELGPASQDEYALGILLGYEQRVGDDFVKDFFTSVDAGRLAALSAALADFVAEPPFTPAAAEPFTPLLPALWADAVTEVRRRLPATEAWGALAAWHEVRKAAKAARYGAEVLVGLMPAMEARRAEWERVTEALGATLDAVVTHRQLGELALGAAFDGHPGALPGALWLREEQRLAADLDRARAALTVALAAE